MAGAFAFSRWSTISPADAWRECLALRRASWLMAMFGDLLVQFDPWQVEYGAQLPFEDASEAADDYTAALDIELASDAWRTIRPD